MSDVCVTSRPGISSALGLRCSTVWGCTCSTSAVLCQERWFARNTSSVLSKPLSWSRFAQDPLDQRCRLVDPGDAEQGGGLAVPEGARADPRRGARRPAGLAGGLGDAFDRLDRPTDAQ